MQWIKLSFILLFLISIPAYSQIETIAPQTIPITELESFSQNSKPVQALITKALALTTKNLTYKYGSANPKEGGMDCSGTIYYLLNSSGQTAVPRQSDQIQEWVVKEGKYHAVTDDNFNSSQFSALKPGDLLFWSGTYAVTRQSPITHVMMYLGQDKAGHRLMFGASNGRTYQNKKIWGVSVFDFKLTAKESKAKFVGYSCIPAISC